MKKIAVIQDLSGLGKCSLTAAIPVISVMGVQACPLPTAILSNQTGYDSYYCDDYTNKMPAIMEEWKKRGFSPDGIYTGFLAGEAQVDRILEFLKQFCREDTQVIVDPVMGDDGTAYKFYTDALCEKLRLLVSEARVITPNLTEALLLLEGKEGMERLWKRESGEDGFLKQEAEETGRRLLERFPHLEGAVITGVHFMKDGVSHIGNLIARREGQTLVSSPKQGGSYSGTGDLFASVISAGVVRGETLEAAARRAVRFLGQAIADAVAEGTNRNDGVCFERYLHLLWEAQA